MPVTHEILGATLVLRMIGQYEPADIRAALASAFSAAAADTLRGVLFDVSQSTSLQQRDARSIRMMAAFLAHLASQHRLRIALVGTSDLAFALMRLGAADLEAAGVSASVFRTDAEAQRWVAEWMQVARWVSLPACRLVLLRLEPARRLPIRFHGLWKTLSLGDPFYFSGDGVGSARRALTRSSRRWLGQTKGTAAATTAARDEAR